MPSSAVAGAVAGAGAGAVDVGVAGDEAVVSDAGPSTGAGAAGEGACTPVRGAVVDGRPAVVAAVAAVGKLLQPFGVHCCCGCTSGWRPCAAYSNDQGICFCHIRASKSIRGHAL